MTIVAVWKELDHLWCVADTRITSEPNDRIRSEVTAKIHAIPILASAYDPEVSAEEAIFNAREHHYRMAYGFAFAGSASPASQAAATASTLLQRLMRPGPRSNGPTFESVAELIYRLSNRFMIEARRFSPGEEDAGLFTVALFGWCHHAERFKVAKIEGRSDYGPFRLELSYPTEPAVQKDPWLVLGSGAAAFNAEFQKIRSAARPMKFVPRAAVEAMVRSGADRTVGGAISLGVAHHRGFELIETTEAQLDGAQFRTFNGLDLDNEVGPVGEYHVGTMRM